MPACLAHFSSGWHATWVRLNERWTWTGDTISPDESGIVIWCDWPGHWWLVLGSEMVGPFDDSCILRALRVANTPVIDGCELGPSQLGWFELENRRALSQRRNASVRHQADLPPSTTSYDEEGLAAVVGCCSRFDSPPHVNWNGIDDWQPFRETPPSHAGTLERAWNAHPAGSLVFCDDTETLAGLTLIDLPVASTDGPPGRRRRKRAPRRKILRW
jgi:hypothetical protein